MFKFLKKVKLNHKMEQFVDEISTMSWFSNVNDVSQNMIRASFLKTLNMTQEELGMINIFYMQELENKIYNEDWSFFNGHPLYEANLIAPVLIDLLNLNDSSLSEEVANKLINVVGSNHEGTYYPVIIKALEYIISIEKNTENRIRKICSKAILNDLYYFEPDITNYYNMSNSELKEYVKKNLNAYSDENIKW